MKKQDIRKTILADLYSRPNTMSGKYKEAKIVGLENINELLHESIFFLETLKVRADSADRIFDEAKEEGKDLGDPNVMKELGEKINALGQPIHQSESIMSAIFVSLHLVVYYGIAIGIWGLVFKRNFLTFGLYGIIAALIISFLFVAPVIAFQRTKERIKDLAFSVSAIWGNLAIIIGVIGLVALIIRLIFIK